MSGIYQKTIKNLLSLGASLFITMLLGAVLKAILPRYLGVEGVGQLYFAESIASIVFTILPLGLHVYINRHIPNNQSTIHSIFSTLTSGSFGLGVLLYLVLVIYSYFYFENNYEIKVLLVFSVFELLRSHAAEVIKPMFIAADKIKFVSRMDIIGKGVQTGLVSLGVLIEASIMMAVSMFLLSQILINLAYLSYSVKLSWLRPRFSWVVWKPAVFVGFPFFLNQSMVGLYGQLDIAIMEYLSDTQEIGWFGAAQRLKGLFLLGVPLIYSVFLPMLSKSRDEGMDLYQEFFLISFQVLMILSCFLSFLMILFSGELVQFLYGDQFKVSSKHLMLLAPVLLFTYLNVYLSANLSLVTNGKVLTVLTALSLVVNASLNFLFIPWGLEFWANGGAGLGASITTIVAEILVFCGMIYISPIKFFSLKNTFFTIGLFTTTALLIAHLMSNSYALSSRIFFYVVLIAVISILISLLHKKQIITMIKKFRT